VEHVHHTSINGYVQSRGDRTIIQRVGCLCPIFLGALPLPGDGVGGDLST